MALQPAFTSYIIRKSSLRGKSPSLRKELKRLRSSNPSFWEDEHLLMWCSMAENWEPWDIRLQSLGLQLTEQIDGEPSAADRAIYGIIGWYEQCEWLESMNQVIWLKGTIPGKVYGHMLPDDGVEFDLKPDAENC